MTTSLVITGANGFIGRHFLAASRVDGIPVRALTRSIDGKSCPVSGVEWIVGDLADPSVWSRLVTPGSVVVNLAYSQVAATADAVSSTCAMVEACARAGAARIVHCSTISVFGRTDVKVIDEATPCNPVDAYGRQKLAVEAALLSTNPGRCQVTILRPAAVFGEGGKALQTLAMSLSNGPRLANFARSSLFGRRRMHLVPVESVVAALRFLAETERSVDREIFIVGADEEPLNNFRDVECRMMCALHLPAYAVPPPPIPQGLLGVLLRLRGRSEVDPDCRYSSAKLMEHGFVSPILFEAALQSCLNRLADGEAGA